MGGIISHAAAPPPPLPVTPEIPPLGPPLPGATLSDKAEGKKDEKIDWLNLPCPVSYEEIQRETMMSLKPELFEGLRFDFTKPLSPKFSLSH
eukprot:c19087_g1_i3 orf=1-273(-)